MVENPITFRIDRGIGQYDFNDYYAVLGLPLTADASHVRKRYILIAKCLHPDIHGRTEAEKKVATQYLSKLVNPAYNVLSQERERTEYSAILKLLGKRLMKRNQKFSPKSEIAHRYLTCSQQINYESVINEIAKVQYTSLDQILENIGLLSELNLVHILLQEGYQHTSISSSVSLSNSNSPNNSSGTQSSNSSPNKNDGQSGINRAGGGYQMRTESQSSLRNNVPNSANQNINQTTNPANNNQANKDVPDTQVNQYITQAEKYISQNLWASALKELRSAIHIDCNNSKCHALLGFVYMNQKLAGMAKVSFQQSLKLNPDEPIAKQYIAQVTGTSAAAKNDPKSKNDKKGGFFGWLGGG
jgi:curved DNA-binding protein CbpA